MRVIPVLIVALVSGPPALAQAEKCEVLIGAASSQYGFLSSDRRINTAGLLGMWGIRYFMGSTKAKSLANVGKFAEFSERDVATLKAEKEAIEQALAELKASVPGSRFSVLERRLAKIATRYDQESAALNSLRADLSSGFFRASETMDEVLIKSGKRAGVNPKLKDLLKSFSDQWKAAIQKPGTLSNTFARGAEKAVLQANDAEMLRLADGALNFSEVTALEGREYGSQTMDQVFENLGRKIKSLPMKRTIRERRILSALRVQWANAIVMAGKGETIPGVVEGAVTIAGRTTAETATSAGAKVAGRVTSSSTKVAATGLTGTAVAGPIVGGLAALVVYFGAEYYLSDSVIAAGDDEFIELYSTHPEKLLDALRSRTITPEQVCRWAESSEQFRNALNGAIEIVSDLAQSTGTTASPLKQIAAPAMRGDIVLPPERGGNAPAAR